MTAIEFIVLLFLCRKFPDEAPLFVMVFAVIAILTLEAEGLA